MPTWSGIAKELEEEFVRRNEPPSDYIRRKYLASLSFQTQQPPPEKSGNVLKVSDD